MELIAFEIRRRFGGTKRTAWVVMTGRPEDRELVEEVEARVSRMMPGVRVNVGWSDRWRRPCLTVTWDGFSGLLPEERFQRLTRVLPEAFREQRLSGHAWLELVPGETVEEYLALPRSEDVADREGTIYRELVHVGLFDALSKVLGPAPDAKCAGSFSVTQSILGSKGFGADAVRGAKLAFIRHGAYCDCQVLGSARQALAEAHAGAA